MIKHSMKQRRFALAISAAITAYGLEAPEMDLIWYLRRAPVALS